MGAHAGRLGAQIVSRGKGHSAVSKAAYNARASLENERLGTRDDYSRKHADCLFSGIYAPAKSPEWTHDREQLWNHVEAFEKRKDAQLARELLIDLPHELTPEQSRWFLQDFIKENFTRKGMIADLAIHAPHQHSDKRNIHAHLLIVLRKLDGSEFAATKTRQTYAENVAELDGWKRSLEQHANKALTRHGHEARWDLRSNEARGVDREPEIHLGKAAAALEREGIETAPGNINREIRERNRQREAANENDRGDWVREQIAEAEAATLPELEAVQRDRDMAAAEACAELEAETTPQHREARPVIDGAEFVSVLDAIRAREAQERGDDSASRAAHALDELAKTDPHGTARNFGYQRGDRLKSPEEMRREWADLMRGGVSADRAAENAAAWEKVAEDLARDPAPAPTPETAPQLDQVNAQSRDHLADRAAWAKRLRGFTAEPVPEPHREAEADRTRERAPEPESPAQAPENGRGGVFQKLRAFVRGWFETALQPAPPRDRAADRDDLAGDRQADRVNPAPAEPAHAQQPEPDRAPQQEQERPRPSERARRSLAKDWLAEDRAELKAERDTETPAQRQERERAEREADHSRGHGDSSRERTRHHHSPLWELFHPWQHHHPRNRHHEP